MRTWLPPSAALIPKAWWICQLTRKKVTYLSEYEDGSSTVPDIEAWYQDDKGRRLSAEEFYRAELEAPILEALDKLRAAIVRVLDSFSIAVLPTSEASKPVPWLRASKEVLLGKRQSPILLESRVCPLNGGRANPRAYG